MNPETFYDIDALIRRGRDIAVDKDVVSFDLFDTLFIRRIENPDIVKIPVARFVSNHAMQLKITVPWLHVDSVRTKYENAQRERNGASGPDHEARYDDYMQEMLEEIFGDDLPENFLQTVADYEMEIEKSVLVVREPFREWMRELHEAGKRVFIASDIYLPSKYLKHLVEWAGLSPFVEDVISSADTFEAKASGAGFARMEREYDLDKSRWLHVGDNPFSDGLRPADMGIQALVLRDAREKQRKMIARDINLAASNKVFWRGRNLHQLMLPLEAENQPRDPLYLDGYNFLGPVVSYFIQRVLEHTMHHQIPRIFFLSREGWMFQECWNRIEPRLNPIKPYHKTSYLHVSRVALAKAACANMGLPRHYVEIALLPAQNRDFRDIARVYGLDMERIKPWLKKVGLTEESCFAPIYEEFEEKDSHALDYLLAQREFQDEIRDQCADANRALKLYLQEQGFFDEEDVALVDVGWMGTIQRFLRDAICDLDDRPALHGLLMGATRGVPFPEFEDSKIEGLLYDANRFEFAPSLVTYALDLFEDACRAPKTGLRGYRMNGDDYELVFRDTGDAAAESEKAQDEYYAPLRQGMLDAAEAFGRANAVLGYASFELKYWVDFILTNRMAFPRAAEVARLRNQSHLDDYAANRKAPAYIARREKALWKKGGAALRLLPGLRLKYYFAHALRMLQK